MLGRTRVMFGSIGALAIAGALAGALHTASRSNASAAPAPYGAVGRRA